MTKRLMKDALLELLAEKDLANISVTSVCETADVHRSTFYNYYTDPASLLRDIEHRYSSIHPPAAILPRRWWTVSVMDTSLSERVRMN